MALTDMASRTYDHGWRLDPIVRSLNSSARLPSRASAGFMPLWKRPVEVDVTGRPAVKRRMRALRILEGQIPADRGPASLTEL
jgi:hypothetical protein